MRAVVGLLLAVAGVGVVVEVGLWGIPLGLLFVVVGGHDYREGIKG